MAALVSGGQFVLSSLEDKCIRVYTLIDQDIPGLCATHSVSAVEKVTAMLASITGHILICGLLRGDIMIKSFMGTQTHFLNYSQDLQHGHWKVGAQS